MPNDLYPEPERDDWEPPSIAGDLSGPPLNPKAYVPELVPLDIPPYVPPTDQTGPIIGWGAGTGAGRRDQLSQLTPVQRLDLLDKTNIYLSTQQLDPNDTSGLGAMTAWFVGKEQLTPATSSRGALQEAQTAAPNRRINGSRRRSSFSKKTIFPWYVKRQRWKTTTRSRRQSTTLARLQTPGSRLEACRFTWRRDSRIGLGRRKTKPSSRRLRA